jgi:hypothetical protein
VLNDTYLALDRGEVIPLLLLDLTAAFDVVSHELLLEKLQKIGISDSALNWMKTYLQERPQKVYCNGTMSGQSLMLCGVPQGAVLGPLLFSIFINDISMVIDRHGVKHILYADDIQLLMPSSVHELQSTLTRLENCVTEVTDWLNSSQLILNANKTEFIILSSKSNTKKIPKASIVINGTTIQMTHSVRNLGVILDNTLSWDQHVNQIRKSAFMYLALISKVRKFVNIEQTSLLVQALAVSRVNYCASLLLCFNKKQQTQLQKILNYGVRLIDCLKKRERVSDSLAKHGWLNISERAELRLAVITFTALHCGEPQTLASTLNFSDYHNGRTLRSETNQILTIPRTRSNYGDKSFAVSAASLFNSLPLVLRLAPTIQAFKSGMHSYRSDTI